MSGLVQMAISGLLLSTVQLRYEDLDAGTLGALRNLREYVLDYHLESYQHGFVYMFKAYHDVLQALELEGFDNWEDMLVCLAARYYRSKNMRDYVDYVHGANAGWPLFSDQKFQERLVPDRKDFVQGKINPLTYMSGVVESMKKTLMGFDLLFAAYDKTAWPNDIYGNQLQPIKKDGKVIGAYSMGENGIDDGWENERDEQEIWLYDHIER